jgi:hypothetical protein
MRHLRIPYLLRAHHIVSRAMANVKVPVHIVRAHMPANSQHLHPPLEKQIPTIEAVWNWSQGQPRDIGLIFRVILAHMAEPCAGNASPLVERVAFSFSDFAHLGLDSVDEINAERLDEILGFLASVEIEPEALAASGLRLRRGALLDLVKTHAGEPRAGADYWLVCGGQWASVLLESAARDALCRIARASLTAERRAHPDAVKTIGLAIFETGMRQGGAPMTLDFLTLAAGTGRDGVMAAALSSLEQAGVIEALAFSPDPPARPTKATFALCVGPRSEH